METTVKIGSHTLNMEPHNVSMDVLARRCVKGRTTYVRLMPGDATLYEIYVVPFKNPHLKMSGTTQDFVLLAIPGKGAYPFCLWTKADVGYIRDKLGVDEWTAKVVAEFLRVLWTAVQTVDERDEVED